MDKLTRRSFLKTAGLATGAAAVAGTPALAAATAAAEEPPAVVNPEAPPPHELIVAYVRDAARGEVTVLWGENETTYRDPGLARRLQRAARVVAARR
jgi:hypothetical protein